MLKQLFVAKLDTLFSGLIVHPIYRYYLLKKLTPETTTNNSTKVIRNTCRRIQGRFLLGGLAIAPFVSLVSIWINRYSWIDVQDKCYQIRCDQHGLVYDRTTAAMGLAGWYWKRFQGAVDGVNLAILYTLFFFNVQKPYTNVLIYDREVDSYPDLHKAMLDSNTLLRFLGILEKKETSVESNEIDKTNTS